MPKMKSQPFPGNLKGTWRPNIPTYVDAIRVSLINPAHVFASGHHKPIRLMDNQDKLEVSIRRIGELRNILTGTRALS